MPFARLVIPDLLLEEVIEHARQEAPLECCGLLAGTPEGAVTTRYVIENVAHSPTAYETDPRGMLFAFRDMRSRGIELLAIYHSHPTSEAVPSRRDLARNTYGETVVHLIVGLADPEPDVRAWWLGETDFRVAELLVMEM